MSVSSHIEQLQKKHQTLSDSVEVLQRSPSSTDAEIAALKKQKLAIKEEIGKPSARETEYDSEDAEAPLDRPLFRISELVSSCIGHRSRRLSTL